jgi:hypothetical protein
MGINPDQFPTIAARRQQLREADNHDRARIAAATGALDAANDCASGAAGAADAARGLAEGLGGPEHIGAASVFAATLAARLDGLAVSFARFGAFFGTLADLERDEHLAHLRGRYGTVPGDYVRDLLGAGYDHRPPGHADTCPGYQWHATHPTCPPAEALFLFGLDLN